MAHQPSWVIQNRSDSSRRTAVILFNPYLGDNGVLILPKGISSKVNVITRLEFELVYFEAGVQHVSHYATGSSTVLILLKDLILSILVDFYGIYEIEMFDILPRLKNKLTSVSSSIPKGIKF